MILFLLPQALAVDVQDRMYGHLKCKKKAFTRRFLLLRLISPSIQIPEQDGTSTSSMKIRSIRKLDAWARR